MEPVTAQRIWMPIQERLTAIREGFFSALPDIIAAAIVVVMFYALGSIIEAAIERSVRRFAPQSVWVLFGRTAKIVTLILGVVVALGVLGLQRTVTTALAGAGIIGIVLGFALQDVVANLASGLIILFRKPFQEGDLIGVKEQFGIVKQIDLPATKLQNPSGQMVYVPNKDIFGNDVENYSEIGIRRVDLLCGISYGDDLDNARKVAKQSVEALEYVIDEEPVQVFYQEFSDHSIKLELRFWIDFENQLDFLRAQSEAIQTIKKAFSEHGITIPFPIRTLDFNAKGGTSLSNELSEDNR